MKANINLNEETSNTQEARILAYLKQGNTITPVEALTLFGSFRLGARIADIKAKGYLVHTEMVKDTKTGKRYAQYSLI